ncbi:MAG: hypothetical protein LBT62_04900 [Deltaproteobacteria bacterium]|nr:hypothetical protein [Deltaproteobacteria bacterium]
MTFASVGTAQAQDHLSQSSFLTKPYDFEAAFTYSGSTISPQDAADLDITLINKGFRGDTFSVETTSAPEGWTTQLRRYNTVIKGLFLGADESATLTLSAAPAQQSQDLPLPTGDFPFSIKITSLNGEKTVESSSVLTISTQSQARREALTINTSYPEIGGPSDGRFSFSLDIKNNGSEDALVNLLAEPPLNWEASFKPGYEDKQISSIHVPKGQSRSVTLDVTPAYQSEPGAYPIKVKAEQPLGSAETLLSVNLTGTYKLRTVSANDLLSISAEVGKPVTVTLFAVNEGSAPQKEIAFLSVKPDNWEIEFDPPSIQNLEPHSNPVEIAMTITPAANALVGDYGIGLNFQGDKAQSALDFRVTVKAGSAWAGLGALLIVLAVIALAYTFKRLGRR